jgi:hypothetical protein
MTTFNYYANIPNAPDNPSFDQPLMQTNSQSINGIWSVDHVTFDGTGGSGSPGSSAGQHKQVTFNGKNVPGAAPLDPVSILYTNSGVASTVSDMYFRNANAIFPVNLIRAYAACTGGGTLINSYNVNSVFQNTGGGNIIYNVTLATGVTNSTSYGILATPGVNALNPQVAVSYVISGVSTFNLNFRNYQNVQLSPDFFTFIVIQI